jgi:hypothetical protein
MMNNLKKEYFNDYCYFLIEGDDNDFTLSYSVYSIISESDSNKTKKRFNKKDFPKIEDKIKKIVKSNKKISKKELDELVDSDGTMLSSRIPILNKWLTPKKTMNQTIMATRTPGLTFSYGGGRRLYGENENEQDDFIYEIELDDAFGYKETKFKDFKGTMQTLKKMGIDDPEERVKRTKQFGKLRGQKVHKTKDGKKVLKQRLVEKEKLDEIKKERMIKMVEDILTKKGEDKEFITKEKSENGLNKILTKNLENIKKIAKKEGININKLINILKQGE